MGSRVTKRSQRLMSLRCLVFLGLSELGASSVIYVTDQSSFIRAIASGVTISLANDIYFVGSNSGDDLSCSIDSSNGLGYCGQLNPSVYISAPFTYFRGARTDFGPNTTVSGLVINGNGFKVDGNGFYPIFTIGSSSPLKNGFSSPLTSPTVTINNLRFENCWGLIGGAMYISSGTVIMNSCSFINNKADFAGGLQIGGGTVELINCVFDGNEAIVGERSFLSFFFF